MWLYLPELNCAQASECLAKASEPHSDFLDTTIEPWLTSSGKPLQPRSLSRSWKANAWMRRLSGLTCSRSTAANFAAKWIASLPDSHARICQSLDDGQGLMENDPGCFSGSATLPTIARRKSSFWRTSQPSLLPPPPLWTKPKANSKSAPPPESWENWPTEGGIRNGSLFPRPKWEPATAAPDGSASRGEWLTPNVPNGGRSVPPEVVAAKGMTEAGEKRTVGLESQSKHWATPDCNTSSYSNGRMGPNIREQTASWTTPTASERSGQGERNKALRLDVQQWASPRASDGEKGGPNQRGSKGDLMLPSMAAQWPTPKTPTGGANSNRKSRGAGGADLQESAQAWPTPSARDFKSEQGGAATMNHFNRPSGPTLSAFVAHSESSPQAQIAQNGPESSNDSPSSPRRLNPAFAAWLMGVPWWWTNPELTSSAQSEMESYQRRLDAHLSRLCGDQESPSIRKIA